MATDQVRLEFIVLLALTISLVALAIDSMLPALSEIATDLGVTNPNDRQMVITVLFAGFGIAQILYGPVSDSVGRKPAIYAGFVVFIIGSILAILSQDFTTMLVGRFLQGFGAAGPRTVVVAMVRDRYEGRAMARIMSLVTLSLHSGAGAGAVDRAGHPAGIAHWRAIFWMLLVLGIVTCDLVRPAPGRNACRQARRRELSLDAHPAGRRRDLPNARGTSAT